jgi:hypothetical protein
MKLTIGILGAIAILALAIFSPFVTIWCLNTLFPVLAIPYTFETWLAMLLVNTGTGFVRFKYKD